MDANHPAPPTAVRAGVLAGGNWIVDHLKVIDAWPPQDSLANILEQTAANGGGPYNVLSGLARLGATFPLEAVGLIGNDADGAFIAADCRRRGIDARQLRILDDAPTSYTDVMTVRGTGRRTFFHQRGANARLAPEHFDFAASNARLLYLGYALLLDALDAPGVNGRARSAEVLQRARAAGLTPCLDCVSENSDRFGEVVLPILPHVDVLFVNDFEAEKLTGMQLGRGDALDFAAITAAGAKLIAAGVGRWAIIHCPEGVYARNADGRELWQGSVQLPPNQIAGAAGAGDALAAGLLLGLHEGWPMGRCLELGVCAAAASLRHVSCSEGIGPVESCLALGRQYGFRRSQSAETGHAPATSRTRCPTERD